ncbi:endoxylanase [Seonamhaeicola sp. NFXS20]|uniref:sugar-binding protein n=1 Tax=Seonamhaeicola sp. NFXS20 TaxID=2816959 RepID=UPI003B8D3C20
MSKIYRVNKILEEQINTNSKIDNLLWKQANVITDFCSPWEEEKLINTEFRALWDNKRLYFHFKVYDPKIHIHSSIDTNDSINNSDRVELFFRKNESLNPYYCLEIDPTPRIMDFKALPNRQFDFNWNWPQKDILINSCIEKKFFTVEGYLSIDSLKAFNLIKNNRIEVGVYRAKYKRQKGGMYKPIWITWVNPKTEIPNFHIASSFGVFELQE